MIVALASPRVPVSLEDGLERVRRAIAEAADRGAEIVCFPEAYLPGLRGMDFPVPSYGRADQERALEAAAGWARERGIATILGMEWIAEEGSRIAAVVVDADGSIQGMQTKTQIAPAEEAHYVPGSGRRLFRVNGVPFGVAICHEGFRYPETVRWAAARGAKIVFHPHCTGSDRSGTPLTAWAAPDAPYYEKAILCRGLENTIYVASVNYAMRCQESATCLIDPEGRCLARLPYGAEGVLVQEVDVVRATGMLAARYAPERY